MRKSANAEVVITREGTGNNIGAFLNFGGTNIYKSKQLEQIGEITVMEKLQIGDYFCTLMLGITVIPLRCMAELLGVTFHWWLVACW